MDAYQQVARLTSVMMIACGCLSAAFPAAAGLEFSQEVEDAYPRAYALYTDIHQHPELSGSEVRTAAKVAAQLRGFGYTVTEHIGGTGVVAVLENGAGPTVLLRAELDALPVEEKTGLSYASKVSAKNSAGREVPVGHMSGHDLHIGALVATAGVLSRSKDSWHGRLVLVGQPAEETVSGAAAMIREGLFRLFPRPDSVLTLHVSSSLPAGKVGIVAGTYTSNYDSLRIIIYGKGGHGASPQTTVDPVVTAARTILALQTISSREVKPGELSVVTVGYISAGTQSNVIPDQAELGLSIRTYKTEVRRQVLAAVTRITNAESVAAGAPRAPMIENLGMADAVYNDPELTKRIQTLLESALGTNRVVVQQPIRGSDDFSYFTGQGIPGFYLNLGGADPDDFARAQAGGAPVPSNHSSLFAPDVDPALRTAITAELAMLRGLLKADKS